MSQIRVNNITNRTGIAGPTVAGIASVNSSSHFVVPTGRTGTRYADDGENIVRSGLVLYLDAKHSYPSRTGIGTTTTGASAPAGSSTDVDVYNWYDMSGYENNGELVNRVGYNAANGGSLVFDGFNDYVDCGGSFTAFDLIDKSFQSWVKRNSASTGVIIDKDFDSGSDYGGWGFWIETTGKPWWWVHANKDIKDNGSNSAAVGSWTNIAIVWNSSTKTASFYINGVLNSSISDVTIVEKPSGSSRICVGAFRNGTGNFTNGSISQVLGYTRQLTAAEVLQNYNATKSRYGL